MEEEEEDGDDDNRDSKDLLGKDLHMDGEDLDSEVHFDNKLDLGNCRELDGHNHWVDLHSCKAQEDGLPWRYRHTAEQGGNLSTPV